MDIGKWQVTSFSLSFLCFFYHVPHCRNIQQIILANYSSMHGRVDCHTEEARCLLFQPKIPKQSVYRVSTVHIILYYHDRAPQLQAILCMFSTGCVHFPVPDTISHHPPASSALACGKRSHEKLELPEVNTHFYSGRERRRGTKERIESRYIRNLSFTCSKRASIC